MSDRPGGGGGFGGVFVLLIVVGFVVKFWVWIVAVLGAAVLFGLLCWAASAAARRADAERREQAALVARADDQHRWILGGDDHGTYGDYMPSSID